MESGLQPIPVSAQKRDPAWNHCQLLKDGDRLKLRCIYCGKMFSGGGIHRIKEHLAGQKGNAATCPRVQKDVQHIMLESLNGGKVKRKKHKLAVVDSTNLNSIPNEIDTIDSQSEEKSGFQLHATPVTNYFGLIPWREEEMPDRNSDKRKRVHEEEMTGESSDRRKRQEGNSSPPPTNPDASPIDNITLGSTRGEDTVQKVGQFLYDVGVSQGAVNSIYFQPMIDAFLSEGSGLKAPSYHDVRGWVLKNSVVEVKSMVDQYKETWGRTGCSLLVDEWTMGTGRVLINFFAYCPKGTIFLKYVDASDIVRSTDALYGLLKEVVEEVGVQNVLQVITDSAEHYIVAGKRLTETFPTMYWTPCSARCIDLMLEDIGKFEWISEILENARTVTRFVYNHASILNMTRRYNNGKDLVQPAISSSATNFTTLRSMVDLKSNLQAMVTSQEWMDCHYSKKPDGIAMLDVICSESFWSSCGTIVHITDPLLRVLRMVGSEKRPAMGYIYASMYRAKEAIKKELVKKKYYLDYWNVIDHRWERQLARPLHAAAFYLNPKFFYGIEGDVHNEIMSGMLDCIERLVPEIEIQDKITKELNSYKNAVGDFGRKMAARARHTLPPDEWWSTYGGGCPNLTRLAIRILSQTCSMKVFKRHQISPKQIHHYTANRLERKRLSDLVFVEYNLRLRQMQLQKHKESEVMDPISIDIFDIVEEWVAEKDSVVGDIGSPDWTALVQPEANTAMSFSPKDEAEALVEGFGDYEIYNGVNEEEDTESQDQEE
ncbi:uncharacterized protein LOC122058162 [Macadamia integrifolia]|uniref:uncharacterized protein LOC122058162 n=1 Tax=Macadamia integrifolia TaxID=60698 RepID=UPI001C52E20A|nr:uncharacterized protein LOC122058162 [Macadamia integrifolia]